MSQKRHFRNRDASLWQSAVDKVTARHQSGGKALDVSSPVPVVRPDPNDPAVAAAAAVAEALDNEQPLPSPPAPETAALGVADTAKFCATAAFKLAQAKVKHALCGDDSDEKKWHEELETPFNTCDHKWVETITEYVSSKVLCAHIPYRPVKSMSDAVIDNVLPEKGQIAIIGDWGTGSDGAKLLLRQIAAKKPDVVIHLGDVYYSGTDHEYQNFFYKIWQPMFGLPLVPWGSRPAAQSKPATYTLAGNHDMYAGGSAYYTMLDMLGQPASYFCLRNKDWQFIGLDTGLHDENPTKTSVTFLEDREVEWLADKIHNADGRRTVLLSHHQLFTRFEDIGGEPNRINSVLLKQLEALLPSVTVWYWGHEHNFVIYPKYLNVLARCIGHGAVPVAKEQLGKGDDAIPCNPISLGLDENDALFLHGYAMLNLDGAKMSATYYQFDVDQQDEKVIFQEDILPSAATATGS